MLYAAVGVFGAALFGRGTESNIMMNAITSSPWGNLLINGCMLFYLAAGAAACQYPLRTSIDLLLMGERAPMTVPRAVSAEHCAASGVDADQGWSALARMRGFGRRTVTEQDHQTGGATAGGMVSGAGHGIVTDIVSGLRPYCLVWRPVCRF